MGIKWRRFHKSKNNERNDKSINKGRKMKLFEITVNEFVRWSVLRFRAVEGLPQAFADGGGLQIGRDEVTS